jgi:hypothetical protein
MSTAKHYDHFLNVYDENTFQKKPSEYHLMVFWKKPENGTDALLEQISEHFAIQEVFNLHWTQDRIVDNFQRFYAMIEGHAYHKYTQAGVMPFLMVIVKDIDPIHEYRLAGGSGYKMVNTKSFDMKQKLRRQKSTSLHATNTHREFRRDLMFLTGRKASEYIPPSETWDGEIVDLHRDIIGADGWKSLPEVFEVLNEAVDYVVLRNFEELPDEHVMGPHSDIDFLVEDVDAYHRAAAILNKEQAAKTFVGHRDIYFDFRAVEDAYYDPEWCRRLLREKVMVRGFYAVSPHDYFFSLLYHGHVHKPKISKDYGQRLLPIAREIGLDDITPEQIVDPEHAAVLLAEFLKGNGFYLTRPNGCPAFNEDFVSRMDGTPFLYQSKSNFYKECMIMFEGLDFRESMAGIHEALKSRKWLFQTLMQRLAALPGDLIRRNLTRKQKDFLRPYVQKYTSYYKNR